MEQKRGVTGLIVPIQFNDTTSVIGGGKTGLTFATSGLICYYKRELDTQTRAVTLQTMTLGTWASGGFVEVDVTHDPGGYELGLPNAAVGTSDASRWVKITLTGASGAYAPPLRIDLTAVDFQDATRMGLTALPNATAGASGGLPVLDSALNVAANVAAILGTALTETVPGYLTAAFKKFLNVPTPVFTAASVNQTGDNYARLGAPAGASLAADIAEIEAETDAIQAQTDTIGSGSVTVASPVLSSSSIQIVRGDDYKNADGRALSFTLSGAPSITGATVTLIICTDSTTPFTLTCTVSSSTTCYAEMTSAQTLANFGAGLSYNFDLQAVLTNSDIVTLVQGGTLQVLPDVR